VLALPDGPLLAESPAWHPPNPALIQFCILSGSGQFGIERAEGRYRPIVLKNSKSNLAIEVIRGPLVEFLPQLVPPCLKYCVTSETLKKIHQSQNQSFST
jgi:hypothetical protein